SLVRLRRAGAAGARAHRLSRPAAARPAGLARVRGAGELGALLRQLPGRLSHPLRAPRPGAGHRLHDLPHRAVSLGEPADRPRRRLVSGQRRGCVLLLPLSQPDAELLSVGPLAQHRRAPRRRSHARDLPHLRARAFAARRRRGRGARQGGAGRRAHRRAGAARRALAAVRSRPLLAGARAGRAPLSPLADPGARLSRGLLRVLGVAFGVAVAVGNTIGSGILRTPGEVAALLPSPALFLGVWALGGVYAFLSALSIAELG